MTDDNTVSHADRDRDRERFNNHLKQASKTVKSWPEWKQGVLGRSSCTESDSSASQNKE